MFGAEYQHNFPIRTATELGKTELVSMIKTCLCKIEDSTSLSGLVIRESAEIPGMLSFKEKEELRKQNIQQKFKCEQYLRSHSEIKLLFSKAIENVLIHKPEEKDIEECMAKFFTQKNLKQIVMNQQM